MTEQKQRSAVIAEAKSWLLTPYHHAARIKGAGVDCMMLLAEVYAAVGVIMPVAEFEHYPMDWMLHKDDDRYSEGLLRYCRPVEAALPGDVAMFRFGRVPSHSAIVIEWPLVIHAYADERGVVISNAEQGKLSGRCVAFYSPWGRA